MLKEKMNLLKNCGYFAIQKEEVSIWVCNVVLSTVCYEVRTTNKSHQLSSKTEYRVLIIRSVVTILFLNGHWTKNRLSHFPSEKFKRRKTEIHCYTVAARLSLRGPSTDRYRFVGSARPRRSSGRSPYRTGTSGDLCTSLVELPPPTCFIYFWSNPVDKLAVFHFGNVLFVLVKPSPGQ